MSSVAMEVILISGPFSTTCTHIVMRKRVLSQNYCNTQTVKNNNMSA